MEHLTPTIIEAYNHIEKEFLRYLMLQSTAQELFVIDPTSPASQLPALDTHEVSETQIAPPAELEVSDAADIMLVVEELPGAPAGTPDPQPVLEVAEEP